MQHTFYRVSGCLIAIWIGCMPAVHGIELKLRSAPQQAAVERSAPLGTLTPRTLIHDSLSRDYLEYQPSQLPSAPLPLVIALHGGSEEAASAASVTRPSGHWRVIADRDGFILAYPNGVNGNWNDCGQTALTGTPSVADDVGFMRSIVRDLSARFPIDPQRIYATGASNGGLMASRLSLESSDLFAGVASFISTRAKDSAGECRLASNPSTVMIQAGTLDPILPYDGSGTRSESFISTRNFWRAQLGCIGVPVQENYPDLNLGDGSTVSAERFGSCREGVELHMLTATGAGHVMPSISYPIAGLQNRDFEAAEEAWRVLQTVRLGVDRYARSGFE